MLCQLCVISTRCWSKIFADNVYTSVDELHSVIKMNLDQLIECALKEIEVSPSGQDLARENLRGLADARGLVAIEEKIEAARARKRAAREWVVARREERSIPASPTKIAEARGTDIQQKLRHRLEAIARDREPIREWAQYFIEATKGADQVGGWHSIAGSSVAPGICRNLFLATQSGDFEQESAFIRGSVFAEAANALSLCGMEARKYGVVEQSLLLYGRAVRNLREDNGASVGLLLAVIQLNRGSTLSGFGELIHNKIQKFKADIEDVKSFFAYLGEDEEKVLRERFGGVDTVKQDIDTLQALNRDLSLHRLNPVCLPYELLTPEALEDYRPGA